MSNVKTIRGILIAWFLVISGIIIIWSIAIPFDDNKMSAEKPDAFPIPSLPKHIGLDTAMSEEKTKTHVSYYTQQVEAYKKHTEAYSSQLTAYNKYLETGSKFNQLEGYKTVVKDTLSPLITGLLASLFAFAFAKTGLEVLNNYVAVKNGQPPQPLTKFF